MAVNKINREQFEEMLRGEKPVLIDYSATWCGYCRRIEPVYSRIEEEYRDVLIAAKIDIDEEEQLSDEQQIEIIPTLVLYKNGNAVGSIVNPPSKMAIDEFIKTALEK